MSTNPSADELEILLIDACRRLEEEDDHAGLAQVWWALGFGVANARGRHDDWATASLQAYRHRRLAGRLGGPTPDLGISLIVGSRPADEALEVVDRLLAETPSAWLLFSHAWLLAMLDRGDDARQAAAEADARLREQGDVRRGEWILAEISALADDHEDASNRLSILCDWLEAQGQFGFLDTYQARLGRELCLLGRFDEAEEVAERARALERARDPVIELDYTWRRALARVHAHRGELAEAERLAREAVTESERSDSLDGRCLALWDLGDVLAATGRREDADAALGQALERAQRKKNLALARQVRARLAELRS